ncbi:DinB family protein [Pedobacter mendelii]|uniref:DNA damage-inducible protein DinB n=1 Tax=Pedobacter mendelii TaxID=1908240 RepID=A0ABQ2BMT0_9SPHI|nr:DinB family protein [Pedobacter mendelii]GGI27875.1 DNA damage-inducible protein DinB [Pedobacter mendelii]
MIDLLAQQYNLVLSSRKKILDYIKTIAEEDFLKENSTFGRGSVRNLLVHICDTYSSWIGERALKKSINYKPFEDYKNLNDCIIYFDLVNLYLNEFFESFGNDYQIELEINRNGQLIGLSPLKLFTHVITHEFHHKGQIMSLSRHLGYTPVDADILR